MASHPDTTAPDGEDDHAGNRADLARVLVALGVLALLAALDGTNDVGEPAAARNAQAGLSTPQR